MSTYRSTSRHSWLPTSGALAIASVGLGGVALLHLLGGASATLTFALAVLTLSGLGGMTLERRLSHRRSRMVRISCQALSYPELAGSSTLDLSAEGFFVLTSTPYPVLTRIRFQLSCEEGLEPIEGEAIVRWINKSNPKGMGVEIMSLEHPERFTRLLEGRRPTAPSERKSPFRGSENR